MDLLAMFSQASSTAAMASSEASEAVASADKAIARQRRKSRELEQDIFGMHLTDVEKLRTIFNAIDIDKNGHLDERELGAALVKAGKSVSNELVRTLLAKYDADGNGTLEFDEYQAMIKDWDEVTKEIEDDKARLSAALDAAKPISAPLDAAKPKTRSRKSSKDLLFESEGQLEMTGGQRSRRSSRDDLLAPGVGVHRPRRSSMPEWSSQGLGVQRSRQSSQDEMFTPGRCRQRSMDEDSTDQCTGFARAVQPATDVTFPPPEDSLSRWVAEQKTQTEAASSPRAIYHSALPPISVRSGSSSAASAPTPQPMRRVHA